MAQKRVNASFKLKFLVVIAWSFSAFWLWMLTDLQVLVWLLVMREWIVKAMLIFATSMGVMISCILFGSTSLLLWRWLPIQSSINFSIIVPIILFCASLSYGRIDTQGTTQYVSEAAQRGELQNTREQLLIHMARYGLVNELKALINVGTNVNAQDPLGRSALYWAREPEILKLLQTDVKPDVKALVSAAQWGRLDAVKLIFKATSDDGKALASDISDRDLEWIKTVHNGEDNNREQIVQMLMERRTPKSRK